MLKLAYPYQEQLNKAYQQIIFKDKYKYFNLSNYWNYEMELDKDSWNSVQMVSVDKNDNILGYLSASFSRPANKVSSIGVMNFHDMNITFSKDFYEFLNSLFLTYDFHKIEWSVVIGNPAEKMYDKIINKYGGRVVGVYKESTRLQDGKYYDVKDYEIFKRDYERNKK